MELTQLPITDSARELIATSIANYQRHARLRLSVDTLNGTVAWCTAHQYEAAPNGRTLAEGEIMERASEAFQPLRDAGITPIICVYTVADGGPMKPVTKHRSGAHITLRGITASALRIAQPRVLFHTNAEGTFFLANEDVGAGFNADELKYKAAQWVKRTPFRDGSITAGTAVGDLIEERHAAKDEVNAALIAAGIDPEKPLSGQGVSFSNNNNVHTYIRDGRVIVRVEFDARHHVKSVTTD